MGDSLIGTLFFLTEKGIKVTFEEAVFDFLAVKITLTKRGYMQEYLITKELSEASGDMGMIIILRELYVKITGAIEGHS